MERKRREEGRWEVGPYIAFSGQGNCVKFGSLDRLGLIDFGISQRSAVLDSSVDLAK